MGSKAGAVALSVIAFIGTSGHAFGQAGVRFDREKNVRTGAVREGPEWTSSAAEDASEALLVKGSYAEAAKLVRRAMLHMQAGGTVLAGRLFDAEFLDGNYNTAAAVITPYASQALSEESVLREALVSAKLGKRKPGQQTYALNYILEHNSEVWSLPTGESDKNQELLCWIALGIAEDGGGSDSLAQVYYRQASKLEPSNGFVQYWLGQFALRLKQNGAALQHLKAARLSVERGSDLAKRVDLQIARASAELAAEGG